MRRKGKIMFAISIKIERSQPGTRYLHYLKTCVAKVSTAAAMSSCSSLFVSGISLAPRFSTKTVSIGGKCDVGLVIENSSRPKKKATSHHMKTRPRKTQPWDIRRKPTVYAPLPPLPPDWTLVSDNDASDSGAGAEAEAAVPSSSDFKAPPASG